MRNFRFFGLALLLATTFSGAAHTQTALGSAVTLPVDDFESGVAAWTRGDKNNVGLADIVATKSSSGAPGSSGAALLAFKSSNAGWASLSRPVDGPEWARIGATRLVFWISGSNEKETQGVNLQLRAKNVGSDLTFSLPLPIRIDETRWRKVAVPLSDFKGPKGEKLAPRMGTVYSMQFVQSGKWNSRFFNLDDIVVQGSGKPIVVVVAPPKPAPVAAPAASVPGAAKISVDFLRVSGALRAAGNVSIGSSLSSPGAAPLETSASYRTAIGLLKPKFIRLDVGALADLSDSSRPSFDFARLLRSAQRARALGAEPLIAVTNPPEWGLNARAYSVIATDAARALNQSGGPRARYFELAPGDDIDGPTALSHYNAAYGALKTLSKNFRVGGYGAPAGALAAQVAFLQGARGLDFLTVSSFGAGSGAPSDAVLLSGAREVSALKTAAGALDKSKFPRAALFVTQAGLSAARNPGDSVPSDIRLVEAVSGAWWAQFLASGSRLADQIFHNDAVNPEWGLLAPQADDWTAYPAYRSLWLWNTFFPPGSKRVFSSSSNPAVFVSAANTATAHNVLVVNTSNSPQTAQLSIRGFPVLREARLRIFDDPQQTVRFEPLPKSPFQTLRLAPYAVAVVQFIEPPRR